MQLNASVLPEWRDLELHESVLFLKSHIIFRKEMRDIVCQLKNGPCNYNLEVPTSFTKVLQGPGGSGKTTTLTVAGYFAKKSGCIVLPIQGNYFTDGTKWLNHIVY